MKVVAWGSLLWDPRELEMSSEWRDDGPSLPIEFSRISADGRLTLVVDPIHGCEVRTWSCDSPLGLRDAIGNLSVRERCPPADIGWVDVASGESSPHLGAAVHSVREWCAATGATGAVWTALPSTFMERCGMPFSVPNALRYLDELEGPTWDRASEYIRRAPQTTMTEVRRAFEGRWPVEQARPILGQD